MQKAKKSNIAVKSTDKVAASTQDQKERSLSKEPVKIQTQPAVAKKARVTKIVAETKKEEVKVEANLKTTTNKKPRVSMTKALLSGNTYYY